MLRAYECRVVGSPHVRTLNAVSASKARYQYYIDVSDCWPDVRYIDVRSKFAGKPQSNEIFRHVCELRGVDWHVGDKVEVLGRVGWLADACSGANFEIHTAEGHVLYAHPSEIRVISATVPAQNGPNSASSEKEGPNANQP